MVWKTLSGIAVFVLILLAVLAAKALRLGPPRLPEVSATNDVGVDPDAPARLAEAIRYRTISHGTDAPVEEQAMLGFHQFLERSFPKVHVSLKRETVSAFSLLYTWEGSDPSLKPILLAAHMDVVPVEPETEDNWTHPPFAGVIADGFIWGRGALDMKQSLMGILEAVEILLGEGFTPRRTVYLAFGHDEEIGGSNGAAKIVELLEQRRVRLEFTLDEGLVVTHGILPGVARPAALIGVAEKGLMTLELTAQGEGGHASMPPRTTAVGKLGQALHRLAANPMPAALKSPVAEMFEHLGPEMPFMTRVVLANRWLLEPLLLGRLEAAAATNALIRTTIAPTIVGGGSKENVLPTVATAILNVRILQGDSIESVIEHVQATINDAEVTVRQVGNEPSEPSQISDIGSSSFAVLRSTVHQVFPDATVAPGLLIGRTDSRHYAGIADNSYRFLPMRLTREDLKRIHGTDERVAVDNYAEIIRFYIQLLRNAGS
jgi:carboxypeptidase PM20D1